jgi:hypothetical protein
MACGGIAIGGLLDREEKAVFVGGRVRTGLFVHVRMVAPGSFHASPVIPTSCACGATNYIWSSGYVRCPPRRTFVLIKRSPDHTFTDDRGEFFRMLSFAFPYDDDSPSERPELRANTNIASGVGGKLRRPKG